MCSEPGCSWHGLQANYDLPFGRNKRFAGNANRVVNGAIGGWIVNGIYQYQSGQVLSWGNVIYYGGDLQLNPRGVDGAFDKTRFNTRSTEQSGPNESCACLKSKKSGVTLLKVPGSAANRSSSCLVFLVGPASGGPLGSAVVTKSLP